MKRIIFIIAALALGSWIVPASAQAVTATLPVTCPPSGVNCVQSQPVVNPDGTNISTGGPSSSQLPASLGPKTGAGSLSVVPNTDTAFPVSDNAGSLTVDCAGAACATAAKQDTMIANQAATGASAQNVQGAFPAANTGTPNPMLVGGRYNSTMPTYTTGQIGEPQIGPRGILYVGLADATSNTPGGFGTGGSDTGSNNTNAIFAYTRGNLYDAVGATWVRARGDTSGAVIQPYAVTSLRWTYAPPTGGIVNSTTGVTVQAAAGGSLRIYVTGIQCDSDVLGAATEVTLNDGASGTTLWRGGIATSGWLTGRDMTFPVPLKGTANTLLELKLTTASVTGGVRCNVQGYTAL